MNKKFKVFFDTKIYIVCPPYYKTGGTELAHQLVKELNNIGRKAMITYYGDGERLINPAFLEYVDEFCNIEDVEDNNHNIIVFPEIVTEMEKIFSNIQKSIWWMSVDNYLSTHNLEYYAKNNGYFKTFRHVLKGKFKLNADVINKSVIHLYQSEYARLFLNERGIVNSERLSDYINDDYLNNSLSVEKRENIVLYNPRKGFQFTKKIIHSAKNCKFVALENLTNKEVKDLLNKSKVYIDFGNHPGKDRFPREAAICGCCVITGKDGAAGNEIDIPIENDFKIDAKDENISLVCATIRRCLENYDTESRRFENYRVLIRKEHSMFCDDVKRLFGND